MQRISRLFSFSEAALYVIFFRSLRIGAMRSRFLAFTIAPNRSSMQSIRFDSEVGKHKPCRFAESTQGKMRIELVESTRFRFLSNSVEPLASLMPAPDRKRT